MAQDVVVAALVLSIAMLLVIAALVRYMFKRKPKPPEPSDKEAKR